MKVHQMLSHMRRNRDILKLRPRDIDALLNHCYGKENRPLEHHYLDSNALKEFFRDNFPLFTQGVKVKLNRWQSALVEAYKRSISYKELMHVHNWWDDFGRLPKRTYIRLDQHDPYLAGKGQIEQEKWKQWYGSIQAGVKYPIERKHDLLVVVGTATGYDEQLASVTEPHDTMGVNGAAVKIECDYWYSIHGSYLRDLKNKVPENVKRICEWWIPGVDSGYGIFNPHLVKLNQFHYSGNMACLTGLVMGYKRILMVGCPLAPIATSDNLLKHDGKLLEVDTWAENLKPIMPQIQDHFLRGIVPIPEFLDRVRSISGGFTQQILGDNFNESDRVEDYLHERERQAEAERLATAPSVPKSEGPKSGLAVLPGIPAGN